MTDTPQKNYLNANCPKCGNMNVIEPPHECVPKVPDIKQKARKEFERSFPDIFHLPKGGMSVWLEESYTRQMLDLLDILISSVRENTLEEVREIVGVIPENWKEERWRYDGIPGGILDERERLLTALSALKKRI